MKEFNRIDFVIQPSYDCLVEKYKLLIDLSQLSCSEDWQEIESATDDLIKLIEKQLNK
tara:strand:+ start:316 stop:489 length:174 start_codon:yes stop_codon:yes gene_type:complete